MALKIVIDTNVLLDAEEDFYRYAHRIVDLVLSGNVEAYANASTLRENKLLAQRKITDSAYLKILEYFFDAVKPVGNIRRLAVVADDAEDNKILESAVAARADYLITSDRHLLNLEKYQGTRIVRPNEFWSRYEEEGAGWANWLKSFIN